MTTHTCTNQYQCNTCPYQQNQQEEEEDKLYKEYDNTEKTDT